ncbi:MAG: TRAP transporter small permease [Rhizobiaceae bacterium]|nr:TRAP transporter small permease [Rhizobiaceae bacterium]
MIEHERTGPVDTLTWSFSRIAMWAPAFIVGIIFYEVVMRYIFFQPTLWVNEMSLWIGGFIYVTAGLYAMQQRSHIRIFVLYDIAPLWMRRLFDLLSVICVCIFVFAVVWGGFGEAAAKFWRWETFGTAFDPPIPATNKPLVLITLVVLALQAVSNLIRDWPSTAIVRKTFDVLSVLLTVTLAAYALPVLFNTGETGPALPMHWRIGLVVCVLLVVAAVFYGLIRDFNRTPVPLDIFEDPAEGLGSLPDEVLPDEVLPDEVLSGNPPKQHK